MHIPLQKIVDLLLPYILCGLLEAVVLGNVSALYSVWPTSELTGKETLVGRLIASRSYWSESRLVRRGILGGPIPAKLSLSLL